MKATITMHGHAKDAQATATSASESRFARGLRIGLVWLVVAVACYVAYSFGRLWAEWRQTGHAQPASESHAAQAGAAALLPLAGQWSFAELDWDFQSRDVAATEVDAVLTTMIDQTPSAASAPLPDIDDELLELAKSLRIEPIEHDGNQIYRLDDGDVKSLLVTRSVGDKTKAVALAAAFPQNGDTWRFVQLIPRSLPERSAAGGHLLPLPKGASRAAGRFADDGTLLLELVTLRGDADRLLAQWEAAGWEVRSSGLGGPDDFSYLCARGDDVIYAWSANPRHALANLMLVRSPGGADTSAQ